MQHKLGMMYGEGRGVPQDYTQALKWIILSHRDSYWRDEDRDELQAKMTISQIEEAQRLVREWSANHAKEV